MDPKSQPLERRKQGIAPLAELLAALLEDRQGERLEGRHGRQLPRGIGRDEQILRQALHHRHGVGWTDHPADPPPRHPEVLREAVDHIEPRVSERQRTVIRDIVDQSLIDLVDDQGDATRPTERVELGQRIGAEDRARRVGGRGDDERAHPRCPGRLGTRRGQLEIILGANRNLDRFHPHETQHLPIAGIGGIADQHLITRLEQGMEYQLQRPRGAWRHQDPLRGDRRPITAHIVVGDPLP